MSWVRLDDSHQEHPKIAPLSDRAYRLWVRAISHSNKFGLNGDLTASQLRQVRGPIRAKNGHETELIAAGLWRKTDSGISIHDISKYQPMKSNSLELSQKRSDAGKKGAAARWESDGKLPLAKNAPVPIRPDPSRPQDRSLDKSDGKSDPNEPLDLKTVHQLGYSKYGDLNGVMVSRIGKLCPIMSWEFRDAAATDGKSWGYFAKVVLSIREEAQKENPPPGTAKNKWDRPFTPEYMREKKDHG